MLKLFDKIVTLVSLFFMVYGSATITMIRACRDLFGRKS